MFKKKPSLKPYAPLRSSDRRKLATSVIKDFDITPPTPPQPTDGTESTADPALSHLRNVLFPENTQSTKFQTTLGPELSPVSGLIYVGTHDEGHEAGTQRPLWVKTEDVLFPTVYTLIAAPDLLPIVYTHTAVMQKLQGGADLMAPGLIGPPFPAEAKKGTLVGVGDYENLGIPLAVGVVEMDLTEIEDVQGLKGKAVRILHWVEDELWKLGGEGGSVPEKMEGVSVRQHKLEDSEEGGVMLEQAMEELELKDKGKGKAVPEPELDAEEEEEDFPKLTTQEIDMAFRNAFLYSLYNITKTQPHANLHQSLPFPVPSAFALKELIIPFLPSHHPSLTIQKTSWKKIQKMLKTMEKELITKNKERNGDVFIYAVNWECDKMKAFKPYPLSKPKPAKKKVDAIESSSSTTRSSKQIKIIELFKPGAKLVPIYEATSQNSRDLYTAQQLSTTLSQYFTLENLVSAQNARLITVNPILSHAILQPGHSSVMTRDSLIDLFKKAHKEHYQLNDSKPHSGAPPRVTITLETRQGAKTVTKVKGLEVFGVKPEKFAEELKSAAASAATTGAVVGSKPSEGLLEVMVQGNMEAVVTNLLEKYGVGKKWLTTDNKLKKKK